ncbi:MAG: NAD(P)-dependent oxidoreductase [Leucobacter sp.]
MVIRRVLFIGLGNMGGPMAQNLTGAGFEVLLFDANTEAVGRVAALSGARPVESTTAGAAEADAVILMLPNSAVVERVLFGERGVFSALTSGALVIDMGSSEPASTVAVAEIAARSGFDYVDAPVSGGVAKAESGELSIMVGGAGAGVERAHPLLQVLGSSIVHTGPSGTGHAAKALNNLLSATNLAAAAEVLIAARKFGIASETMLSVINGSTGRSQASEVKYAKHVLNGAFDSGFAMDLMLKDLAIARRLLEANEVTAPLVLTAEALARDARESLGNTAPDHTEFVKYYEQENRVLLRAGR